MSTAQIMDLYALSKRRQARDHLLKGGIVQPEIQSVKIKRGTDAILLTKTDLANITKALSEEQRTIADRLQSLTTGVLAAYGNQASMRAYGYKKFTDPDYWPTGLRKKGCIPTLKEAAATPDPFRISGWQRQPFPMPAIRLTSWAYLTPSLRMWRI